MIEVNRRENRKRRIFGHLGSMADHRRSLHLAGGFGGARGGN